MLVLKEFREFAMKGNVVDMAVGIVIGSAFGKIVSSLVSDMLTPPLGMLLGKVDFSNLFIDLSRKGYASLAEAQSAGAPTINIGLFLNTIVDFIIVAFALFMIVRWMNKLRNSMEKPVPASEPAAPTTRECPFCLSVIPVKAIRCAHCTADLTDKR